MAIPPFPRYGELCARQENLLVPDHQLTLFSGPVTNSLLTIIISIIISINLYSLAVFLQQVLTILEIIPGLET